MSSMVQAFASKSGAATGRKKPQGRACASLVALVELEYVAENFTFNKEEIASVK